METRRRIAGSAGSEPPAALPAAEPLATTPGTSDADPLPTARLIERDGRVVVEIAGRRARIADADLARLRGGSTGASGVTRTAGGSLSTAPRYGTSAVPPELRRAIESVAHHREALLALPGVVSVRAGYKFIDGWITAIPAMVVAVTRKRDDLPREQHVPPVLPDGTPTDVTPADPLERLAAHGGEEAALAAAAPRPPLLIDQLQDDGDEGEVLEAVPAITYQPPPGATLDSVTGPMVVTCHVSPDAGWAVLRPFLEATRDEIVLGMYDFTAPHIYQTARSLLRDSQVTWRQTLGPHESLPSPDEIDSTKADDRKESSIIRGLERVAKARFDSQFARVGSGRTFSSAYHIKVAVRDRSATWLSSGNWQSSNQPAFDLLEPGADRKQIIRFNREWHAVVEHPALATIFRRYLTHDFETALEGDELGAEAAPLPLPELLMPVEPLLEEERAAVGLEVFPPARFVFGQQDPLTIQPILTPDNYLAIVLELLRQRPERRLYFQNQSLNPVLRPTSEWAELLDLLAGYSRDASLDVRIIIRDIGPIRKKIESLQAAGFDMERIRVQRGCHTKGIVLDGETVLLGSHNWTDQGIQTNRDASVLIRRPEIAAYYERIFLHDWDRLARPTIREEAMPVPLIPGEESAALEDHTAFQRLSWSEWEAE